LFAKGVYVFQELVFLTLRAYVSGLDGKLLVEPYAGKATRAEIEGVERMLGA